MDIEGKPRKENLDIILKSRKLHINGYQVEKRLKKHKLDLTKNQEFIRNYEISILLTLLDKNQLNKWQFECCMEEIKKGI